MSRWPAALVVLVTLSAVGCTRPDAAAPPVEPPAPPPAPKLGRTLAAGVAFLLKQQSPDGAWRSDTYAAFKDGTALTPLAVCALQDAADTGVTDPDATDARRRGSELLAKMARADGTIDEGDGGLEYPVYTAALAVKALSHPENKDRRPARDAWLKFLLDRQLIEANGWQPGDTPYGGWGYCRTVPKKPEPGGFAPPLVESNLSATVFALDALTAAGVTDRGVFEKARAFVHRCQNFPDPRGCALPPNTHLDGGFHFIYDDPVRNKAGAEPDTPPGSPPNFYSYGSTTADGFRALLLINHPDDAGRRTAARWWLAGSFRADTHPGRYIPTHERNREAVYFYYAASAGRAFQAAKIEPPDGRSGAVELSAELAKRQRADGSWANAVELVRENDPLVATCQAVIALANCRAK